MKKSCGILASCLLLVVVAGLSTGCNKDADMSKNGTVVQQTDPTAMPQQGAGGSKAQQGGGMMPQFKPAAPGEKTGVPK